MDYASYMISGKFWFAAFLSIIIAYLLARKFSKGSSHVDLSRLDSLGYFMLYFALSFILLNSLLILLPY